MKLQWLLFSTAVYVSTEIPDIIKMVLAETEVGKLESISRVLEADALARRIAHEKVEQLGYAAASRSASSNLQGE